MAPGSNMLPRSGSERERSRRPKPVKRVRSDGAESKGTRISDALPEGRRVRREIRGEQSWGSVEFLLELGEKAAQG